MKLHNTLNVIEIRRINLKVAKKLRNFVSINCFSIMNIKMVFTLQYVVVRKALFAVQVLLGLKEINFAILKYYEGFVHFTKSLINLVFVYL